MERRAFVKNVAASLAGLHLFSEVAHSLSDRLNALRVDLTAISDDAAYWARVREEFLLRPEIAHLNCGSIGATPRSVVEALTGYIRELEANPYAHTWSGFAEEPLDASRTQAAEFLGASPDEVAITRNTTEGMNLVGTGMQLQPGDEILTTDHEHPGGMFCWLHMAQQQGVRVVQMKMPAPPESTEQILQLVEDHLTPRTRIVSVSHVTTMTGLQMPLAGISAITRPRGILLVCDGAQAPGMLDVDVKALGVDVYASSSHKWMLAPKGSGLLYVAFEAQDRVKPVSTHGGFWNYSASSGTRNVAQVIAHGDTMAFHNTIGRQRIETRCRQLNAYLRQRLAEVESLELLTPADPALSSALVSYRVQVGNCNQIRKQLMQEHDVIVKPIPSNYVLADSEVQRESLNALRISTHIFNSEAQIDRLADLLIDILGKTTAIQPDAGSRPRAVELGQNYPNPFNPSTHIQYELPEAGPVHLEVRNSKGQMVEVLVDEWQTAGTHEVSWQAGRQGSGTYFYRLQAEDVARTRKMSLVR